jgi:hypothetical protein
MGILTFHQSELSSIVSGFGDPFSSDVYTDPVQTESTSNPGDGAMIPAFGGPGMLKTVVRSFNLADLSAPVPRNAYYQGWDCPGPGDHKDCTITEAQYRPWVVPPSTILAQFPVLSSCYPFNNKAADGSDHLLDPSDPDSPKMYFGRMTGFWDPPIVLPTGSNKILAEPTLSMGSIAPAAEGTTSYVPAVAISRPTSGPVITSQPFLPDQNNLPQATNGAISPGNNPNDIQRPQDGSPQAPRNGPQQYVPGGSIPTKTLQFGGPAITALGETFQFNAEGLIIGSSRTLLLPTNPSSAAGAKVAADSTFVFSVSGQAVTATVKASPASPTELILGFGNDALSFTASNSVGDAGDAPFTPISSGSTIRASTIPKSSHKSDATKTIQKTVGYWIPSLLFVYYIIMY